MAVGLIAASAAISIYGQVTANKAVAKANSENANLLASQKALSQMASRREADIQNTNSNIVIGETVSMLDKAGVDITGSALLKIANMKEQQGREYRAIKMGADVNSQIIGAREQQARDQASLYSSGGFNGVQTLGTLLNAGVQYMTIEAAGAKGTEKPGLSPDGLSYTGTGR